MCLAGKWDGVILRISFLISCNFLSFQTAKKLMGSYSKLRELGHPEYLRKTLTQVLPCRLSQEEADQKVCT